MATPHSDTARRLIRAAETPAGPRLRHLRRLQRLLEEGLAQAYAEGLEEGARAERAEQDRPERRNALAAWGRRLSGNRLLSDPQALEWLEDAARRAAGPAPTPGAGEGRRPDK